MVADLQFSVFSLFQPAKSPYHPLIKVKASPVIGVVRLEMDCLIIEKKNEEKCWKTHNPKDTEADPKCDSFLKGESNF